MKVERGEALALLKEFNKSESLVNHGLTVEAVMAHGAEKRGYDKEFWGIVGLLHDLDYERYPEEHCIKTKEILEERGYPGDMIRAILSHGWGICTDVEPQHEMEKFLYACDELSGLITATVLVRPSRSVMDLEVKSVKKKWKTKGFSAGVDRSVIERGAGLLGMDIEDLIAETIEGIKRVAPRVGLAG